ncbi:FGGY-family carbohydrate kinase [Paenibacillus sp. S150]|uniref:FGGY-family carbohydrate kinase n=1 Tax=Paenibacillus sp. S150 TaxID=2749826 RepID=UPI001C59C75E|nr:FGGY-family carbohydrate kinase [Paenibacillus sp. S150]MBW4081179.1 FGGY-family carbohydrate kinase [Paenibacillus sp. S150]
MGLYSLGIDIGTTAVKAILLSEERIVYQTSAVHDLLSPQLGWAEEDAGRWWSNTLQVVREVLQAVPDAGAGIQCIGVSGMVPAIVLLDEQGEPLRNSIQQNDARAVQEIEEVLSALDQKALYAATGGCTNQQHILPRLLWVRKHEPEVYARIATVCGSYDYIAYKLTGIRSLEINWAVESGMFNIRTREWLEEQLPLLGLAAACFPKVSESGEIIGSVSDEAAAITGLRPGIPVIAGSADHVASTLAAGIVAPGDLLIKFGGAGDILYCMDEIRPDPQLFFDYHVFPGHYLLNGCMASSGSLVKWYSHQFLRNESPELFKELDEEAEKLRPGSDGLVILPYFLGEKTPIFDPEARGVMFGLTLSHTRGHVFRAILESVIYGFRHHIEVMDGLGYRPARIMATNGGAKSRFWCQIAANVLNSEIRSYPAHPGSALGVAFLAGKSAGLYKQWEQINSFLTEYRDFIPDPKQVKVYDKAYLIYRELYTNLKPMFSQANELYSE